jgi:hypothetical protein
MLLSSNFYKLFLAALCVPLAGCVGMKASSPLVTNAARVKTLNELGYRELGFPESGMQVGTLILYKEGNPKVEVMSASKDALLGAKVETTAGPQEWSGARALEVGMAASFLDEAVGSGHMKSESSDKVILKNIRKDLMTKQNIYNARLQPDCVKALERYYASEDDRLVGLVYEVLRGDIESSSSMQAEVEGKGANPLMSAEGKLAPSASAKVLASDLVFGYKVDSAAARDIAVASGVRIETDSLQADRILENETRPKYERLRKRHKDAGEDPGPEWAKLNSKKRLELAKSYGQIMPVRILEADRPTESAAPVQATVAEAKP